MKLNIVTSGLNAQPDPFIFEDGGRFYIYATNRDGVRLFSADDIYGEWKDEGIVCKIDGWIEYWAPCIAKIGGKYYLYFSCQTEGTTQFLHVAEGDSPYGPFENIKCLYKRFSIDAHVVETEAGIFLWYAEDNTNCDRVGTRVFVDRLIDPMTPANICKEVITPSFDEEIFKRNRFNDGRDWHTIEGPFWFKEGEWQYVMYSGACYQNDTYHIGYAAAKSDEADLTKVDFVKHTDNGRWVPTMIKNEVEEGVGHHSVIKLGGEYYAVYHARDAVVPEGQRVYRTARICKLFVKDGIIKADM